LSPTRPGWDLILGVGGELRRVVTSRDFPPGGNSAAPPTVLEVLGRLAHMRQLVDDDILGLVTEAHFRGASWADIARRLDRTKQSVHQRYSQRVFARSTHLRLAAQLREVTARAPVASGRPRARL
jgi:hypothetical protein